MRLCLRWLSILSTDPIKSMFRAVMMAVVLTAVLVVSVAPPVVAQNSRQPDPVQKSRDIAVDMTVSENVLAAHLVALSAEQLAEAAEFWHRAVQTNLAEVAAIVTAMENAEGDRKVELSEDLRTANKVGIKKFERYMVVLSAWRRKGGSDEDLNQHWSYVRGIIFESLTSFQIQTITRLVWDWFWSSWGGLRMLGALAKVFLALLATWIFADILRGFAVRWFRRRASDNSIAKAIVPRAIFWVVLIIGITLALLSQGVDIRFALFAVGGIGFLIAYVLQNLLPSAVGGLLLQASRPYEVGDFVLINGVEGKVESFNLISTSLRSFDNKAVEVPNKSVWQGAIENLSRHPVRRVDLVFAIEFSADAETAKAVLLQMIDEDDRCLRKPEPRVFIGELGAYSVNLFCRPWVRTDDYWDVMWDLTEKAKFRLSEKGVKFAFPRQDVSIRSDSDQDQRPLLDIPKTQD